MKEIVEEHVTRFIYEPGEETEMIKVYDEIAKSGKAFTTKDHEIIVYNR